MRQVWNHIQSCSSVAQLSTVLFPNLRVSRSTPRDWNASPNQTRGLGASCRKAIAAQATAVRPNVLRQLSGQNLSIVATAFLFIGVGFFMGALPALKIIVDLIHPPHDPETNAKSALGDESAREVDSFIQSHPLTVSLRNNPDFIESRPHLKIPELQRRNHFTGGILMGPTKVTLPLITWSAVNGKSSTSIAYVGSDLCGHPGAIHAGLLATQVDEGLARCSFGALPNSASVTASLRIKYRTPLAVGSVIVLRARTTKVQGRKAWVEGSLETLALGGQQSIVLAEASGLFIEPRQAAC